MKTTHNSLQIKRHVLLLLGVNYPANHSGIARYAREAGWVLETMYARSGVVPYWWRGDGIISLITHQKDYDAFVQLPRRPMVDLSKGWVTDVMTPRMRAAGRGRPRVLYDNAGIGRVAAEHFLERGYRHVGFLNCGNYWMETERIPAFRKAIEATGGIFHEIAYHKHFSRERSRSDRDAPNAYQWLMKEIRRLPKPMGLFGATDDLALLLLRACLEAGVSVPEEVAVLGCDNEIMSCDFAPIPLSSVDPDLERQGYEAAKLLDRLMDGEPPPRNPIIIPPKGVVTRQSTDILAIPHKPTAQALRFIWEHYREQIHTPDIAVAAGLSRRGLDHAFRQHLHRSVTEEITRRRIEHAKELLLTTTLKAYEVAERSGFSGLVYFSRLFKQTVGVSPREFRRRHQAE